MAYTSLGLAREAIPLQEIACGRGIGAPPREVVVQLARVLPIQPSNRIGVGLHLPEIVSSLTVVASRTRKVQSHM